MSRYLVVFDRLQAKLVDIRNVGDSNEDAMVARINAEEQFTGSAEIEVVVLSAESRADLIRTHSRYFRGIDEMLRDVGDLI